MFKSKLSYFILGILATIALLVIFNFYYGNEVNTVETYPQDYKIVTPPVPSELDFCGEDVPLYNTDIKERIEREFIVNTYWHSATVLLLKNANRWFPVIEPILEKNGIPDDFKYMCMIESNLSNVVSPAGAVGFWQLMKGAAKKYGLDVNGEIDERYNVEKATEAACKYLKDAYQKYGNWTMAAGSYNMGMNGVENQMDRQKTNNYYNLVLNEETTRFVARIISMKIIHQNPERYGFFIPEDDLYEPLQTYTVKINSGVKHFADFAHRHKINYATLKYFNPWLRENYLTNRKKKIYEIKLPVKGTFEVIPELK